MSLIICACDMGLTDVVNMGALEAIDCGCVTAASVLLNMSGAEHALTELKKRPWISLIWQISERGRAPGSMDESALESELNGEIINAIKITGKAPCAVLIESEALRAPAERVCGRFGIRTGWLGRTGSGIIEVPVVSKGLGFENFSEYDPKTAFEIIPEDDLCYFIRMYPGFLDDISLSMTINEERNVHRLADQRLLCSEEFRQEIIKKYRLVNPEDVFTGRRDFVNHMAGD